MRVDVVAPMVYGSDPVEGIERAAAAGADGIEFFDWEGADLAAVREAADEHGVAVAGTLAAGVASNTGAEGPSLTDPDLHEQAVADLERSIEAAATLDAGALIVTVGPEHEEVDRERQYEAIVDALTAAAPVAEDAGVTLVVEPLNTRVDHPGYFLTTAAEAYDIVEDVDSEAVKVLFDIYHHQITEGDVTRRLTENVDLVGHVHIADNPGRNEPGTGELNYRRILGALADAGYDGFVGCEFSPTDDADAAVEDVVRTANEVR